MNKLIPFLLLVCLLSSVKSSSQSPSAARSPESGKVKVLNFATFHMGETSDANSTEFDENNRKNQEDAKRVAELISKFKPTIICVEVPIESDEKLNSLYQKYLADPSIPSTYYGEVGLVAFEVGRLGNVAKLHGIDHKLSYNYMIGGEIKNEIDSITYNGYYADLAKHAPEMIGFDEKPLLEKLRSMNADKSLDFMIAVNADMLAFVGSKTGYEGADEAAKYYQRNLRIYSNLNRIPMTSEDRVFILSGGSHTAFLNEFMKRSPKYEVVNTLDYLK